MGAHALIRKLEQFTQLTEDEKRLSEKETLARVKAVVSKAIRAHREGLDQPTNVSGAVFALMQAVRRGTDGYEQWSKS